MTDRQKKNIWITIPDEDSTASSAASESLSCEPTDVVQNKVFWGAGLVALIVFVSMLLIPRQMAGLMQAQLFDGSFQVVPDFEAQDDQGALFGGGDEEGESEEEMVADEVLTDASETVVEAESEAVSIQIDPLPETDAMGDVLEAEEEEAEMTLGSTEEERVVLETDESADSASAGEADSEAEAVLETEDLELSEESVALLESLSKQLEDYREKEQQNEQTIQELMQMLEDQAESLKPAADSVLAQASSTGAEAAAQIGVSSAAENSTINVGAGTYRYNTHTVTVNPHDVLAQNEGVEQQVAAYQADVTQAQVSAYSQQHYNVTLSAVQGQPDTGPAEAMIFAFFLASMGILLWGVLRAVRA